jgi:hypothetical protein
MAVTDLYSVIGSTSPHRHGLRFLGGNVDDGVTVNGLITGSATSLVQGNHTIGTITAWILCADDINTYTIFSAGDNNVAGTTESFAFNIAAGKLQFIVIDGATTRVDVITTNKVIIPHDWVHVALVQNGGTPIIYVDGEIAPLTIATATELGQWFEDLDNLDNGCIGALYCNNAYTQEYAGYISDVRVYSGTTSISALTQAQIKDDMLGTYTNLTTALTGLRAHYSFDRSVVNQALPGTFDGTIVGAIIYSTGCEFFSRLTFMTTLVSADYPVIAMDANKGMAFFVKAA